MSEQTKKEQKKQKKKKGEAEPEPKKEGVLGYLIGGALGLVVLLGLWALNRSEAPSELKEIPQLTVMVEFGDLSKPETRQAIVDLQKALRETGEMVLGPENYPILLPGRAAEDLPIPHNLQDLTAEQFNQAKRYFFTSSWLVPRIYAPDFKSAVIRVFPQRTPRFSAQVKKKVLAILEQHKGKFDKLWRYSYDMGLTDQDHQAAINVTFGVQTANVVAVSETKELRNPDTLEQLSAKVLQYSNPRVRSKVTLADFFHYMAAVQLGSPKPFPPFKGYEQRMDEVEAMLERCNMPSIVRSDGSTAVVLVTTDAERQDNLDVCYNVAANLKLDKTTFHPNR